MKISRMLNNTTAMVVPFNYDEICNHDWSPAIFKENYRNNENFIGTYLMVLDVDDGPALQEAFNIFAEYSYVIATTRNHLKEKNGKVRDRYRVILTLESPIMDRDTYTATWYSIYQKFPFIDPACKDPARFYYKSIDIANINNGAPVKVVSVVKAAPKAKIAQPTTVKGRLARKTLDFLHEGAPAGSWNPALFKAAKDMQQNNYTYEEALEAFGRMHNPHFSGELDKKDRDTIKSAFSKEARHPARVESSVFAFLQDSTLVMDIEDTETVIAINNTTHNRQKIDKKVLSLLSTDASELRQRINICKFTYNPLNPRLLFEEGGLQYYNTYEPPVWESDKFFNDGPLPEKQPIPELVNRFLLHLVDGNKDSLNYLLDWLHWAITERNFTVLTLIGNEGVGKGALTDLAGNMFGRTNYSKARANIFKGRFNSLLADKRLVLLDELELKTSEEYNLFKDLVNEYIVIEKKGKDERLARNYSSFILASNNRSGIRPPTDDRRFSLIHLTTEKLLSKFTKEEISTITKSQELANSFAAYLLYHEPVNENLVPYKDMSKKHEIEEAGRPEWQDYLLHELAPDLAGQEKQLSEIQGLIRDGVGLRGLIGRRKFEELEKQYKHVFTLTRKGVTRYIKFLGGADGH